MKVNCSHCSLPMTAFFASFVAQLQLLSVCNLLLAQIPQRSSSGHDPTSGPVSLRFLKLQNISSYCSVSTFVRFASDLDRNLPTLSSLDSLGEAGVDEQDE